MLVVADQRTRGIGRQRRLAGAREAEEDRGVAVRPDIRRTVHRHHALYGEQIVEDAEYRLLHLAGIGGAADQHELLGEIDRDHRLAARAMLRGIGTKARQVDDRIFAVERREFGRGRAAEQGTDELAVPREFGDDLDADAMLGLRAAEGLLAIEPVATPEMRER